MNYIKKIISFIADIIQKYLPFVVFMILFSTFILQIFCRYILNMPLKWTYEVTVFAYIWTVLLGAVYASKEKEHVAFSMVYDKCSEKTKNIIIIIENIFIGTSFSIAFWPSLKDVLFMHFKKSPILKISFAIGYSPFVVFLFMVIIYSCIEIYKAIRRLKNGLPADVKEDS